VQKQVIEVAAVGDLHCTKTSTGRLQPYFAQLAGRVDVLVLCGDLTDLGTAEEARVLASELAPVIGIPKLAVLGNHDLESGHQDEVRRILTEVGVTVLDGEAIEIAGIGFAGAKGFAGGFGRSMLTPWGEPAIKEFVNEGVREAMKLESALAKLRTATRVAITHYAPIVDTVRGEPSEILAWLGCSRLEESINRYGATIVFHGHAHKGSPQGRTREGIPVYNVAAPLLRRTLSEALPVRVVSLDLNGNIVSPDAEVIASVRPRADGEVDGSRVPS
jgi:Icc-related predicted phosphoesterase